MEYIFVQWIHNDDNYPIELFSELDDDCYELRKIEVYKDGHFGLASTDIQIGETCLGDVPVPPNHEIANSKEFKPAAILAGDFERKWKYYRMLI